MDPERTPRRLVVRGLCAGLLGGTLAGLLDYALSAGNAARFLPQGTLRLGVFLVLLYGGLGGAAGALVGAALRLLAVLLPDLRRAGAWLVGEGGGDDRPDTDERRLLPYVLGAAAALALLGVAIRNITLFSLARFHAHLPIAALVGAATAALVIPLVLLALLVARVVPRVGPRLRAPARLLYGERAPLVWVLLVWAASLGATMAAVLLLSDAIQLRPRMAPALKALNTGLWTPLLVAVTLALVHVAARVAWRGARRLPLPRSPAAALAVLAVVGGGAVAAGLAMTWKVAQHIDWRPFSALALALFAGAEAAALGLGRRRLDGRSRWLRASLAVVVPLCLLVAARVVGARDRVRKAAFTAGLAPALITAVHGVTDLDRDGYSSTIAFGSDCDDGNAEVHPGAFDWPDDGIDQNCNGHQATATPTPRPAFAPIPPSVAAAGPLNVVLITIDALRADHVGAYGYARPTTPAIDALARESVLFQNGWAHSPSTRYSVPAILIGRYESTIAWDPRAHWPPLVMAENRLMSEMFKERGYQTGALVPAHYFERGWGLTQGFDDYDNTLARLHGNPFNGDPARTTGSSSKELADLAISWLGRHTPGPPTVPGDPNAPPSPPFFLWMHFYDPHYLYETHAEVPSFGSTDLDKYDGEVRFTDLHVGRVLDALRASPAWPRTVVIITADHGEGFGEHGVKLHGYHIYSQQTKVPFIVRVPGVAPRTAVEPVGHIDLFPSLLNLMGQPDEPQLLGRSFVDMLTGQETPRLVFGEVEYEGPVVRKSVASRDWHLIHNVTPDDTFELYHLSADAAGEHDLFEGAPVGGDGEEARLRRELAAWMDQSALPPRFAERVAGNLSATPLTAATPLHARLGDLLAVEGVDVLTPVVKPGGTVEVNLILRALKPIKGWRLFTHLTAPGGRFVNADHEPVEGFVPLAKLRPDQWVRDRIRVTLPADWPPGPLTVDLGLWRGPERAPSSTGGDHLTAATLQVAR